MHVYNLSLRQPHIITTNTSTNFEVTQIYDTDSLKINWKKKIIYFFIKRNTNARSSRFVYAVDVYNLNNLVSLRLKRNHIINLFLVCLMQFTCSIDKYLYMVGYKWRFVISLIAYKFSCLIMVQTTSRVKQSIFNSMLSSVKTRSSHHER